MPESTDTGATAGGSAEGPKGGDASAAAGTSPSGQGSNAGPGTAAGSATTPAGGTAPAGSTTPAFDFDAALKADRQWQSSRRAQEAELKAKRETLEAEAKQYEPLRPMLEHLPKVDQAAVINAVAKLAAGDKKGAIAALVKLDAYTEDNAKLVIELADHVADQKVAAEVPVAEQVNRALAAAKEAERKAAEEAEAKKGEEQKAAEAKEAAEFEGELESYSAGAANILNPDSPKYLPEFSAKFPWCAKLLKTMSSAVFKAEAKRRTLAGESVSYADVLGHFEKQWVDQLGPAPAPLPRAAAPDEIAKALGEMEAGRNKITVRDGGDQARPAAPRALNNPGSAMDEIKRDLDAMEAAKRQPNRY